MSFPKLRTVNGVAGLWMQNGVTLARRGAAGLSLWCRGPCCLWLLFPDSFFGAVGTLFSVSSLVADLHIFRVCLSFR